MQGKPAGRAGQPTDEAEQPAAQRLGRDDPRTESDPGRPAGEVMGDHLTASQAPLAANFPDGRWLRPIPYLRSRMVFSIPASTPTA